MRNRKSSTSSREEFGIEFGDINAVKQYELFLQQEKRKNKQDTKKNVDNKE
ncbi:MAG: hypothetical protein H0Z31_10200 [Bacillus sp. (in: Bacteria)]|jgi:hypothetical protein|nr:hypothetical protein [Bacillus sp. (in: firmicutes)]